MRAHKARELGAHIACALCIILLCASCAQAGSAQTGGRAAGESSTVGELREDGASMSGNEIEAREVTVQVGGRTFAATLEDNAATEALAERLAEGPLTVSLRDYGGFEKVGVLGFALPSDDLRTTTRAGDIVLYQGDQLVAFYGSNTWSYTRLARLKDLDGWTEALGAGGVELTLSLA